MLDQLNDISFLGDVQHKERCTFLCSSLMHLNQNQGLGFRVLGMVIDKRMLAKIAGIMIGTGGTSMTMLVALGARADANLSEACSVELVASCCNVSGVGV